MACQASRKAYERWLRFFKKHIGKGLSYTNAVEEALCFGWIDGQVRRLNEESYALRFSQRRPGSVWAPSNIARVKRLTREGKMAKAGLDVFRSADLRRRTATSVAVPTSLRLPPALRQALVKNATAWKHFRSYPPLFRRTAIWWVRSAKKPETRLRRIRNVVENAARFDSPHF